jgi:hypothetical protein
MQKHGKRPLDEVDRVTKCSQEFDTGTKKRKRASDEDDFLDVDDE